MWESEIIIIIVIVSEDDHRITLRRRRSHHCWNLTAFLSRYTRRRVSLFKVNGRALSTSAVQVEIPSRSKTFFQKPQFSWSSRPLAVNKHRIARSFNYSFFVQYYNPVFTYISYSLSVRTVVGILLLFSSACVRLQLLPQLARFF